MREWTSFEDTDKLEDSLFSATRRGVGIRGTGKLGDSFVRGTRRLQCGDLFKSPGIRMPGYMKLGMPGYMKLERWLPAGMISST